MEQNYFYAQLDEDDICITVSQLAGVVDAPNMITIDSYDITLLGKKYDRASKTFI